MMKNRKSFILLAAMILFSFNYAEKAEADHPKVEIVFYTPSATTTVYAICSAFGDMLNKNHPWLRGYAQETRGGYDALLTSDKLPADRRKNSVIMNIGAQITQARQGVKPAPRKFKDSLFLSVSQYFAHNLLTYDSKLKSMKDLKGKRIGVWPRGSGAEINAYFLLEDSYDMMEEVKLVYLGPTAFKDALSGNMIDAVSAGLNQIGPGKFASPPFIEDMRASKKLYWIPIEKQAIEAGTKKNPLLYGYTVIPKNAIGPGTPMTDVGTQTYTITFDVWDTMDDEVAYELVKFFDENALKFAEYIPWIKGALGGQQMVGAPGITEEITHPGALKYYKEKGYKIGIFPY